MFLSVHGFPVRETTNRSGFGSVVWIDFKRFAETLGEGFFPVADEGLFSRVFFGDGCDGSRCASKHARR
jgi:hypothetical protein